MQLVVNKAACKRVILDAVKHRKRFNRVQYDVYIHLHNLVLREIKRIGDTHPSLGKTIMMGSKKRVKKEVLEEGITC